MAQFELNIYGNNDEIVKRFETEHVRWGVFTQALQLNETLKDATPAQVMAACSEFVKKIFPDITDADLDGAEVEDVFNTFKQLIAKAQNIGGNSKNA